MTDLGGAASPRTDPLPDGLRRDLVRAIAGLDGYANPNTARGDYWDKRLALVFEVVQPYLAAQEAPAPDELRDAAQAVVDSWQRGDIDRDYDRIASAFDSLLWALRAEARPPEGRDR